MDNTLKIVAGIVVVVLVACIVFFITTMSPQTPVPLPAVNTSVQGNVTVYFFYGEECPHCHNVMPFIRNLSEKYSGVNFQLLETWHNQTNADFSSKMNDKLGVPENNRGVPEVIVSGNTTPLIGDRDIPAFLEDVILEQLKKKQ
jgi:thiol-disulfide isomerase/thioredoxin